MCFSCRHDNCFEKKNKEEEKMVEYIRGCGSKMLEQEKEFKGMMVRGWKCRKCGEEILDPNDVD